MSFLCVPNHVHQVSLPFWVIVLRDVDVGLEEQHSLGTSSGFPGCHLHPVAPKAPGGPAAGAATSWLWAWPEDPSGTSTPCAVLASSVSHRNWANCTGDSWEKKPKHHEQKTAASTSCPLFFFLLINFRNTLKLRGSTNPWELQRGLSRRQPVGSDLYCQRPALPSVSRERTTAWRYVNPTGTFSEY